VLDHANAAPPLAREAADTIALLVSRTASLCELIRFARVLTEAGRLVDLRELDRHVGPLCAGVLDLPPEQGRGLRGGLLRLLAEHEALTAALQDRAGDPPPD
jgi:hypothetical protein